MFPEKGESHFMKPRDFRICIVGNRGKMGGMLEERLSQAGFFVQGVDRSIDAGGESRLVPEAVAIAVKDCLFVILCVPADAFASTVSIVAPLLDGRQVLMDITSVKVMPMQTMMRAYAGPVIGTHPLFGPLPLPSDMKVSLSEGHNVTGSLRHDAEEVFKSFGCAVFWATAEEHDRGVGMAQSLNFTVSAAFFATLARYGDTRFLTPSFNRHLEAARKHLTEDYRMFCEFTASNPCFGNVLALYESVLHEAEPANDFTQLTGLIAITDEARRWYAEEPAGRSDASNVNAVAQAYRAVVAKKNQPVMGQIIPGREDEPVSKGKDSSNVPQKNSVSGEQNVFSSGLNFFGWDKVYEVLASCFTQLPYHLWTQSLKADVLYLLAENYHIGQIAGMLAEHQELLIDVSQDALALGNSFAKRQLAEKLGGVNRRIEEAELLLTTMADSADDTLSLEAVYALCRLQAPHALSVIRKMVAHALECQSKPRAKALLHAAKGLVGLSAKRYCDEVEKKML